MNIAFVIKGILAHREYAERYGVHGEPSVNHTVTIGHLEYLLRKHMCSCEINTSVCSDCIIGSDGRPICDNCLHHTYDPETGLTICKASRR